MLRMHIFSMVKWRRGGWGLPSVIIYLEEIIFNNNNNNNNHLDFWDIPFQPREEFSRRGLLPPILGGIPILLYFGLLPFPIPAIPPYLVKTHHIHGPWPIAATNSGSTPNEVLVNSRCLLEDIYWSTTDNHIEDQRNHLLRNLILSSVAFVLLALLQDPSIVLVLSPCDRYCHNWPHPWPRLH